MLINDLQASFISIYKDWIGLIFNPNWHRDSMSITWPVAESFKIPYFLTNAHLETYWEQRNYSFQLLDGSLLQLYYKCSAGGNSLEKACLAYLQYKRVSEEDVVCNTEDMCGIFDELSITIPNDSLQKETQSSNSWLRIDYSPNESRGIVHEASHLHASMSPELRIPLKGVPTPKQFIEAVVAWFYPDEYSKRHLDGGQYVDTQRILRINEERIISEGHEGATRILHMQMPE